MNDCHERTVRWRRPASDVFGSEAGMEVFVDVPGARRQDLSITVEADRVLLETRLQDDSAARDVPRYRRRFRIAPSIDSTAIRAQLENGVLHLTLPVRPQTAPRTIEIEE